MRRYRPSDDDRADLTEWVPTVDDMPERETVMVPLFDTKLVDGLESRVARMYEAACLGCD